MLTQKESSSLWCLNELLIDFVNVVVGPTVSSFAALYCELIGNVSMHVETCFWTQIMRQYLQNFQILIAVACQTSNESSISDLHNEVGMSNSFMMLDVE
jgi:hypothetical protein